jgi:hypothetical protein
LAPFPEHSKTPQVKARPIYIFVLAKCVFDHNVKVCVKSDGEAVDGSATVESNLLVPTDKDEGPLNMH